MVTHDRERRTAPRSSTWFFATELRGNDLYYRVVTNVSRDGFFYEEHAGGSRLGDEVVMDFPLPGRTTPLRVRGEVRFVAPRKGVGVRFTDGTLDDALDQLVASAPALDE